MLTPSCIFVKHLLGGIWLPYSLSLEPARQCEIKRAESLAILSLPNERLAHSHDTVAGGSPLQPPEPSAVAPLHSSGAAGLRGSLGGKWGRCGPRKPPQGPTLHMGVGRACPAWGAGCPPGCPRWCCCCHAGAVGGCCSDGGG